MVFVVGLNFISSVYQHMSNYIYKQTCMIYKTGFRRKSVDLFESVSHVSGYDPTSSSILVRRFTD